jgi:hypothetical protein
MSKTQILLVVGLAALGVPLAYALVKLDQAGDTIADLRDEVRVLRGRLQAQTPVEVLGPTVDLRPLERRVERLELATGTAPASPAPAARPSALARAARVAGVHAEESSTGDAGTSGAGLLSSEPVQRKLQEMLRSGVKEFHDSRRAERFQRWDKRLQQEVAAFGKQQNLTQGQIEQLASVLQESRDRRQEIRRQVTSAELDLSAARKQIEELRTGTRERLQSLLGEKGYEAYQDWRKQWRQTWRSLWRF